MKKNVFLGIMLVLGIWCLVYVGMKIDMWRLGYDMEELESRRTELKKRHEFLQVRVSELTDPQQIARRAQEELQLRVPLEGQVVMVSRDLQPSADSDSDSPMRLVREFSETLVSLP